MAADERPAPRRRDLRDEADYLPESLDDLMALRQRLFDAGHRPQVVGAMLSWLLGKANGEPDTIASDTRATYRRLLRELPASTPPPGPGRRVANNSVAHAPRKALALVAGGGLVDASAAGNALNSTERAPEEAPAAATSEEDAQTAENPRSDQDVFAPMRVAA